MTIQISKGLSGELLLIFDYNIAHINKVKTIKNRKWDPKEKHWIVPNNKESIEQIKKVFANADIIDYSGLVIIDKRNEDSLKPWTEGIIKSMSDELKIKGYSPKTKKAYIGHIKRFINFYEDNPRNFRKKDIDKYLLYLLQDKKHSHSYVNQSVSAIKFFYTDILKRRDIIINISRPKKENKLPEILSQKETINLLNIVENIKHRAILFLIYSAGLRVGEVVRLKVSDIDSERMLIHIVQGKGRKDRYSVLSEIALEELREYIRTYKPDNWLFPGADPNRSD